VARLTESKGYRKTDGSADTNMRINRPFGARRNDVDIAVLKAEAARLFERHGLSGWRFELSARLKRTLGLCDYRSRSIRVNGF
jgi:hypothetical protein